MSISALSAFPTAAADRSSSRDANTYDATSTSSFASVLAAVHAAAPKPVYKPPKEGTSELDGPDDTSSDDSSSATTSSDDATGASGGDTTNGVMKSVAALDPALQEKLARVIARVRAETGHDVTIEETLRSQSRQDTLYAQGRDSAGPVVTWTQNSKHTQGRAVDLLLDGGAASADAYASLQRIAAEEGLRTLGAKDPGHLELPGTGTAARLSERDMKTLNPAAPADAAGHGEISVARVAQVARVAEVKVATPAALARAANVAAAHLSGVSAGGAQGSKRESGDTSGQGEQRGGYGSLGSSFTMHDLTAPAAPVQATGANGAERVARVMAAMDDGPARPLSQITMSVDAGNGTVDRVHVALRGATLNSTIDVADLRTAQTMSAKSDELVRSLTREGLEVESLRVRGAAGSMPAVAQTSQSSSGHSTGSRFERGNPWDQSGREQQQQDGRRQQQREQRKGTNS